MKVTSLTRICNQHRIPDQTIYVSVLAIMLVNRWRETSTSAPEQKRIDKSTETKPFRSVKNHSKQQSFVILSDNHSTYAISNLPIDYLVQTRELEHIVHLRIAHIRQSQIRNNRYIG